ncbi:single-stranded-DNA-specific exonuclease RecJ [Anaerolentibacter hominis]|uniref:single-stranded-DNA-specific exonuclease RecJ n=1 Tax=Anaerolentibacter hominis TaxID=3079009 RepID=UPI0031B806FB
MEQWFIKNRQMNFDAIGRQFGVSPVLARLVVNRGGVTQEAFDAYINGGKERFYNPCLLKDAEKLCRLLLAKIEVGSRVRIIGDYDVDGITATYIYFRMLKRLGADVDYRIPDRVQDGYGIHAGMIDEAAGDGVDTILTCDTGIAAIEETVYAAEKGIELLITDHHNLVYKEGDDGKKVYCLPGAAAVVDPKQEDCPYPFKGICGAAVAYKIACLCYEQKGISLEETDEFLDLAALATVCDVMELTDENRALVRVGLAGLQRTRNIGLRALIEETVGSAGRLTSYHLGFVIGPCINATGRLETADLGMELLLSDSLEEARKLACRLRDLNEERKELTRQGVEQAIAYIRKERMEEDPVLVVYLPDCHESLAGIIAGRIREAFHRPAIVLTRSRDGLKGSGRSIPAYPMYDRLTGCRQYLTRFGGHPMAAGLSLAPENLDGFREALTRGADLAEEDFAERVSIDMSLPFEEVTQDLILSLQRLEPFGNGNPKPQFVLKNVSVRRASVLGANRGLLKLTLSDPEHNPYLFLDGVLFQESRINEWMNSMEEKFGREAVEAALAGKKNPIQMDIVYTPELHEYNGKFYIQLCISHYR